MNSHTITRSISITLTAEECGHAFAAMPNYEQAKFFNAVADYPDRYCKRNLCSQLEFVTESGVLNDEGRELMRLIGESANKTEGLKSE